MPNLNLNDKEAADVANYLLKDIDIEPNIKYDYYEGSWNNLPDFTTLKPKESGGVAGFDLSVRKRNGNFAIRYVAYLHISRDGKYRFELGSDDGSKLFIDGKLIVNNDGVHPHTVKSGETELKKGVYPLVVEYAQVGGEYTLTVNYQGPKLSKRPLATAVTASAEPPKSREGFELDEAKIEKGRAYFASMGCANCHEMKQKNQLIASTLKSTPFAKLKSGGCLDNAKTANIPRYALSDQQRTALAALLEDRTILTEPLEHEASITRTMTVMNCYACHSRGKQGGVEEARNEFFKTNIPEMGDEGRIPPLLDGVGDKLTAAYLKDVMNQGAKDRPYMETRMPRFGLNNVGDLLTSFEKDLKQELKTEEFEIPAHRVKGVGRNIVGEKMLSCIKCHPFGKHKATGIQAVNLTTMTKRLREDWFRRYMINPQIYRPRNKNAFCLS